MSDSFTTGCLVLVAAGSSWCLAGCDSLMGKSDETPTQTATVQCPDPATMTILPGGTCVCIDPSKEPKIELSEAGEIEDVFCCDPSCDGIECGQNECGYECGDCAQPAECFLNECCVASCEGYECGPDGCGGSCGTCPSGQTCASGACCQPDCDGAGCGDDGCGGSCGECLDGHKCHAKECVCDAEGTCANKACGSDGCGGSCGSCSSQEVCNGSGECECKPSCAGKTCGDDDGCGAMCQDCPSGLVCNTSGACVAPAGTTTYKAVSVGQEFVCAIETGGSIDCWGASWKLGLGLNSPPSGTFSKLSAGVSDACAVRTTGEVACWGHWGSELTPSGKFLQVDLSHDDEQSTPNVCGVTIGNQLTCWGGSSGNYWLPEEPSGDASHIAVGFGILVATDSSGTVREYARNYHMGLLYTGGPWGSLSEWDKFSALAAGEKVACGVLTGGGLKCWGGNSCYNCSGFLSSTPVASYTQIAVSGTHHTVCALRTSGAIDCWNNASWGGEPPSGTFSKMDIGGGVGWTPGICGITTAGLLKCKCSSSDSWCEDIP